VKTKKTPTKEYRVTFTLKVSAETVGGTRVDVVQEAVTSLVDGETAIHRANSTSTREGVRFVDSYGYRVEEVLS